MKSPLLDDILLVPVPSCEDNKVDYTYKIEIYRDLYVVTYSSYTNGFGNRRGDLTIELITTAEVINLVKTNFINLFKKGKNVFKKETVENRQHELDLRDLKINWPDFKQFENYLEEKVERENGQRFREGDIGNFLKPLYEHYNK